MNYELTCPECGAKITVDETKYNDLLSQVRNREFENELNARAEAIRKEQESQLQLLESDWQRQISEMESKYQAKASEDRFAREKEVSELKMRLASAGKEAEAEKQAAMAAQAGTIAKLQAELTAERGRTELMKTNALLEAEKASAEKEKQIRDRYEEALRDKERELAFAQDELARYKEMKMKMSTKMIGESLEQHCYNEYNAHLRPVIPGAYFEKDNEVSETGSKGDFIFREDRDGSEVISIMFEMKNEADTTDEKSRHTNESFLKELDKDRREKKCEYAVLVSLLEGENEYYNQGIVDFSYRYPKMYVIRPQFLVPLITMLRNMAYNAFDAKLKLAEYKSQNVDVTKFEDKLSAFKDKFSNRVKLADERFQDAIKAIDKSIAEMTKTKEQLLLSLSHMDTAGNQLDDLTISRLTYGNPTMKKLFAEAAAGAGKEARE